MQQLVQRVRGSSTFEFAFIGKRWSAQGARVLVLDASFNPPTKAHLALARTPIDSNGTPADATLLLLSVTNADKRPKPGDATPEQRLEMMRILANELGEPVAVAAIDAPTFVGKAHALRSLGATQLSFAMGTDTLVRLLNSKYYGDSTDAMHSALRSFFHGDHARVLCAHRDGEPVPESAREYMNADANFVSLVELGETAEGVSSSEVRASIARGDSVWRNMVSSSIAQYILHEGLYAQA
ncbi:Nucleotidylyl transferase [Auricularia subglabra TFB-10046 SS5]|nr:Nucleotidylyl transferase [Auricularia subglabra TFB-10046 SS5]